MTKWAFLVIFWVAAFSSISATADSRMLRGSVVLHKTNSSASSIDQELISPSKLTQLISKLKANRRCFRSLLDAEKCIILTMTSSSSTPSAPNMRTLFGIAFALISTSFFCVDGAIATSGLRGADDVGSEDRKLDQIDGSGPADSIV
ncbi:hypothetical protein GQ600_5108 [Phytophthora cactorum]|nr:hypothetical protein GQ600_5108 [Phytophthora cactorum]